MEQSAPMLAEYLCSVCVGLKLLLDANILHGDIKANNVLMYPAPQPTRRYELGLDESNDAATATDIVGRRLKYQVIDFGKHQTRERFYNGGYGAFTSTTMRPWYNPLCLGFHLMNKESVPVAATPERPTNASDSGSGGLRESAYTTTQADLKLWMPKLFGQIDKYAFMYILWQIAYSSNVLGSKHSAWDATKFNASLLDLIKSCAHPLPDTPNQALIRILKEKWLFESDFRKYMIDNRLLWFSTWDEIYARVWTWGAKWGLRGPYDVLVPNSLRGLATYVSPSLVVIQPATVAIHSAATSLR